MEKPDYMQQTATMLDGKGSVGYGSYLVSGGNIRGLTGENEVCNGITYGVFGRYNGATSYLRVAPGNEFFDDVFILTVGNERGQVRDIHSHVCDVVTEAIKEQFEIEVDPTADASYAKEYLKQLMQNIGNYPTLTE